MKTPWLIRGQPIGSVISKVERLKFTMPYWDRLIRRDKFSPTRGASPELAEGCAPHSHSPLKPAARMLFTACAAHGGSPLGHQADADKPLTPDLVCRVDRITYMELGQIKSEKRIVDVRILLTNLSSKGINLRTNGLGVFVDILKNAGRNLASDLRKIFSKVPIIGQLARCRSMHLKEAAYEVGCIMLFSTLPLWFFPSISAIIYVKNFDIAGFISQGELFIYSASFCGTMVYIISKQYGTFQRAAEVGSGPPLGVTIRFPYGGLFVITSALICMISAAAFFSLRTYDEFRGTGSLALDLQGVKVLSWSLFIVSTALFYCATAYRNLIDNAGGFRAPPADDILDEWEASK